MLGVLTDCRCFITGGEGGGDYLDEASLKAIARVYVPCICDLDPCYSLCSNECLELLGATCTEGGQLQTERELLRVAYSIS